MTSELPQRVFSAVDSMDLDALGELLAEDARFVFGNAEALIGREAVLAGIGTFFSTISHLRHRIVNQWQVGADTVVEVEVTYQRLDGKRVSVPGASIWRASEDGLIDDYRVYIDLAPVYTR